MDNLLKLIFESKDSILEENQLLVAESKNVVLKLIQSKIPIKSIIISEEFIKKNESFVNQYLKEKGFPLNIFPKKILEKYKGHDFSNGIIALASRPQFKDKLETPILVLNSLKNAENVGALMRTAKAFHFNSILFDQQTINPYSKRCIRVSMGNVFGMNLKRVSNLEKELTLLRDQGTHIITTANDPDAIDISTFKFENHSALIIGNEGHGVDESLRNISDYKIKIPISKEVGHLNAHAACAIILYNFRNL